MKSFSAFLIDPYLETIEVVELTDSLELIGQFIGSMELGHYLKQVNQDRLLIANDIFSQNLIPPAWTWGTDTLQPLHTFFGRAIWLNITPNGVLDSPRTDLERIKKTISFVGFKETEEMVLINLSDEELGFGEDDDDEDFENYLREHSLE